MAQQAQELVSVPSGHDLADKVAVVVGGTKNMGLAVSDELARRGAVVVASYGRDDDAAAAAVKQLQAHGRRAEAVRADARQGADVTRLFDHVVREYGGVDLVVHLPGKILKKPVVEFTEEEFDDLAAANARSAFLTLREAGRRVSDNGRIVVISTSLTGLIIPGYGVYAATKAAAEVMVRAMAKEVASRGVTVNVVTPGAVDTPFFHGAETPESEAAVVNLFTPMHRLGQPGDIAPVVGFLLSDRAGWLTGQIVRVNGGMV